MDGGPIQRGRSAGRTRGLTLHTPLYLGGLPAGRRPPPALGAAAGLVGCVAGLEVAGRTVRLLEEATDSARVTQCRGRCRGEGCGEEGCTGERCDGAECTGTSSAEHCSEHNLEEEDFYTELLQESMDGFDEDKYMERLDRLAP